MLVLSAFPAVLPLALPAPAQDFTKILEVGDGIPTMSHVVDFFGVDVNTSGEWLAWIQTDVPNPDRDTAVFSSQDGLLMREHDLLPSIPLARYDSFLSLSMNEGHSALAYVWLRGIPSKRHAVLFEGNVIARNGDFVNAPGLDPATQWSNPIEVRQGGDESYVLTLTMGNPGSNKAFLRRDSLGNWEALAADGDPILGETIFTITHTSAAPGGHYAYGAILSGDLDENRVLVVDDQVVIRSGTPSPVPGLEWSKSLPRYHVAVNRHGDYACDTNLWDGVNPQVPVITLNGEVIAMAGQALPGIAPHLLGEAIASEQGLSDGGEVFWRGSWKENNVWKDGLFLGDQLIVRNGDVIDGSTVGYLSYEFGISADGRYLWFDAQLDTGKALFLVDRQIGESVCGPAVSNSTGMPGQLSLLGDTDATVDELRLRGTQLPPGEFGYFLTSKTQDFVPAPGGSQGNLCLGGVIGRFTDQIGQVNADGELEAVVDLTDIPPGQGGVMPGDTWFFQGWYRDVNPTPTSNFTDAVRVTFD